MYSKTTQKIQFCNNPHGYTKLLEPKLVLLPQRKVYRDSEPGAVCDAVYVVMHDSRTHRQYLCVGSKAPSLDTLLFAINLMQLTITFKYSQPDSY